jgi:NAD(P)-dependent dehydrogenase (short-subunit alcohol dehydrogenase family)
MLKGLQGKTVLVTGAAGGIGRATCRRLVEEGANVVAAVHHEHPDFAAEFGASVLCVPCDVRNEAGAAAGVRAAERHFGGLDLAFLNAGVEPVAAPVARFSEAEYERVFDVNVRGEFLTAKAVVNHLLDAGRGGGILFMASIAGLQGFANTAIYNASKYAVIGIANSLAHEVGAHGIRVNVICPGVVEGRMAHSFESTMAAAAGLQPQLVKAGIVGSTQLGRYATAEEVAAMVAWILSDEVPYCHGETFTLGGGMMA